MSAENKQIILVMGACTLLVGAELFIFRLSAIYILFSVIILLLLWVGRILLVSMLALATNIGERLTDIEDVLADVKENTDRLSDED